MLVPARPAVSFLITGLIDDSSRFAISAKLVRQAAAGPVCEALLAAWHSAADPH
jgi:hypothetical protein